MFPKYLTLLTTALALVGVAHTTPPPPDSYCPPRPASPAQQQRIFGEFYDTLWTQGKVEEAFTRHVDVGYIQHNPFAQNGRQAAIDYLAPVWNTNPQELKHWTISPDGYAWLHHKTVIDGELTAIFDLLRINGTCIVEHWDVIQSLPPYATNPAPFF